MLIKILTKRKEKNGANIEFQYQNEEPSGKIISPKPMTKSTTEIIKEIEDKEKKIEYYTRNVNSVATSIVIVENKYLRSPANGGKTDNIDSLPKYE